MVSKASEDLPEPEMPEITTSLSRGISTDRFFRLWTLAPMTVILSCGMPPFLPSEVEAIADYIRRVHEGSPTRGDSFPEAPVGLRQSETPATAGRQDRLSQNRGFSLPGAG